MLNFSFKNSQSSRGIAMIITLLVIVILTIAVTAFMQSMSLERRTSQAYLNILRAQEAAAAAEQTALTSIAKLRDKPASAIYEKGTASPETPYLYLATASPFPAPPLVPTTRVTTGEALFSTAQVQPTSLQPAATPVPVAAQLTVKDLNTAGVAITRTVNTAASVSTNINQRKMVGLLNGVGADLSVPVNWKYLQTSAGKAVGRFAYWCEDESSKIDLRTAGNADGASQSHKREQGETLNNVSLHVLNKLVSAFDSTNVRNILAFRSSLMGKYGISTANFRYPFDPSPNVSISDDDWNLIQPYVTIYSDHDDRTPDKKRKLDLNKLAQSANRLEAVRAMRSVIETNLPDFGSRYYRYDNHTSATTYSYTSPAVAAVSDDDKRDYLTKICVNILDFIDGDRLPTVIAGRQPIGGGAGDEAVLTARPDPTFGGRVLYLSNPNADDLPVAVGKEANAYLSEYYVTGRPISIDGSPYVDPGASTNNQIVFRLGHYIELRNLSAKTISVANGDFGTRPFIQICHRPTWLAVATATTTPPIPASSVPIRPPDIEIRLPDNLVIPPKSATSDGFVTLTTDVNPPSGQPLAPYVGTIYQITREAFKSNESARTAGTWSEADDPAVNAHGNTAMTGSVGEDYSARAQRQANSGKPRWNILLQPTSGTAYTNATTRIIMGHSAGYLDYLPLVCDSQTIGIGASNATIPSEIWTSPFDNKSSSATNSAGASTSPRFGRSDPRANVEVKYSSLDGRMNTKSPSPSYNGSMTSSSPSTLGAITFNVDATLTDWYRALPEASTEARGDLFSLDTPIKSLGLLGSVYDPASIDRTYRPANRTLRIGQPDSPANNRLYAPNDTNTDNDRIWTGGFGSDDPADVNYDRNAFRLLDMFRTDDLTIGRINLNGLLRGCSVTFDPSLKPTLQGKTLILDALLDQYVFNSSASTGAAQGSDLITGTNLAETGGIKNLVTAVAAELGSDKPFLSPGDLSRLQIFTTTSTASTDKLAELAGPTTMHGISDAGREEFFRRTANLLTTNPLSFTIYTVGQTGEFISDESDVFRVRATSYMKTIISLSPVYPVFSDNTTGLPTSWKVVVRSRTIQ